MQHYDYVVVGSGVSGLTATLLLAQTGTSVALVERAPRIGGSLARFHRNRVPFDTGFHFTGGFSPDGLMEVMLQVMGLREDIRPVFLAQDRSNEFLFEDSGLAYRFPCGIERIVSAFNEYFPTERTAIERYFEMVQTVCRSTASMEFDSILMSGDTLDEDFVSLQDVLDGLTDNADLKALLGAFAMCYGVRPSEVSFANHSRMCLGLYESVARVEGGGDSFIRAFKRRFAEHDVTVLANHTIAECADIRDDRAHRFVFEDGEELSFDTCVFTIHPKTLLEMLPRKLLTPAFRARVSDFEPSAGFFSVFGTLADHPRNRDLAPTIVSLFPTNDVNALLDPANDGDSALVLIHSVERVDGASYQTVSAFEPCFPNAVAAWKDSSVGRRPAEYEAYKQAKSARIRQRMGRVLPGGEEQFRQLDAASVLTFRDYLHSPDGSAYGVKQKLGQFNVLGKLPVRNMYAAGQSSVLPGVVGAMMSSFIVVRAVIGRQDFADMVGRRARS